MEPDKNAGAKDLFKLILHSPALLVTFLVGIALVIFFLVKYGPSSSVSQQNAGSGVSGASAPTATVIPQTSIYIPQHVDNHDGPNVTATSTAPVSSPAVSTTPIVSTAPTASSPVPTSSIDYGVIRSKGSIPTVATYDAQNTGVPIRSAAGSGNDVIGSAGFGSQIQITGPAVQGSSSNLPGSSNGTNLYYPVTANGKTGYVSAFDVTNSYVQGS